MTSALKLPEIQREPATVRNQVADGLRIAIIEGRLRPGERLNERGLSEQFGVGRPLLREAVRQLEAERLVEVVGNRGPIVRTLSRGETADLYQICAKLEGLCAHYFVLRGSEQDIAMLRAAVAEFERHIGTSETVSFRHFKAEYYEAFLNGCHSEPIIDAIHRYNAQLSQFWAKSVNSPERTHQGMKELRQILRCIEDRDAEGASAAAECFVRHAGEFILETVMANESATDLTGDQRGSRRTRKHSA